MSIPKVSIRQVKAARALLGWSQADLAREAQISEPTVKRLDAIRGALEAGGVEFIPENGGGAGVRLRN